MFDLMSSLRPILQPVRAGAVAALAGLAFGAAPALADPALYRLSDEDSEVYIFGTVHLLPPGTEWRSAPMEAALAAADTVYFEAPVGDAEAQANLQPLIAARAINPPGVTLSSMLSEDGRARLAAIAQELGQSPALFDRMQPWFAAINIAVLQIVGEGYDPASGVESVLWPEVVAAGKELAFFETLEEQIHFFADMPQANQIRYLEQSLLQMDETPEMLDQLVAYWAAGDLAGLDGLINEGMREDTPLAYEVILADRNRAWVEEIDRVMAGSGTVFIAVGAAHLPGDDGVISLLRERGFNVEAQ